MGLFDKILGGKGSENASLNKQEAVAAILLVTVAADGHISKEEIEGVIAVSNRMKLLKGQTVDEFNSMMRTLQGYLQKHGPEWLLERAVNSIPQDLRETMFALAADLIFADGSIEEEEKTILERLQSSLSVSDDLALQILEVIQIKNRG